MRPVLLIALIPVAHAQTPDRPAWFDDKVHFYTALYADEAFDDDLFRKALKREAPKALFYRALLHRCVE